MEGLWISFGENYYSLDIVYKKAGKNTNFNLVEIRKSMLFLTKKKLKMVAVIQICDKSFYELLQECIQEHPTRLYTKNFAQGM